MRNSWIVIFFLLFISLTFADLVSYDITHLLEIQNNIDKTDLDNVFVNISIGYYNESAGGTLLLEYNFTNVWVESGKANVSYSISSLSPTQQLWVQKKINNQTLMPRDKAPTVLYSLLTKNIDANAKALGTLNISNYDVIGVNNLNGTSGNFSSWIDILGNLNVRGLSISLGTVIKGVWQGSSISQEYLGITINVTALNNSLNLSNTRQSNDNTTLSNRITNMENSNATQSNQINNLTGVDNSLYANLTNNATSMETSKLTEINNNVTQNTLINLLVGLANLHTHAAENITGSLSIWNYGFLISQANISGITLPMANITGRDYGILVSQTNISGITIPASNVTGKDYTLILSQANLTGITIPFGNTTGQVPQSRISGIAIPANNITNGTFGSNNYIFPNYLGISITPTASFHVSGSANVLALNINNTLYVNTTTSSVGIGTASSGTYQNVQAKLEVKGSNANTGIAVDGGGAGVATSLFLLKNGTAMWQWQSRNEIDAPNNRLILFDTNTNQIFTALQGGNIGIGTTAPYRRLQVNGTGGALEVNDSVYLAVSGGNVGIGTATPQRLLHLTGAGQDVSGNNQYGGMLSIMSNDAQAINTGGSLSFGGKYNDAGDYYTWVAIRGLKSSSTSGNADGHLAFYTRGGGQVTTERMRIADTGNVGIGSLSPTTKLYVNGTVNATRFYSQRTRSFWLPPKLFLATEGTPVLVTYGVSASESAEAWAFDAATQESIGYAFQLPADWVTGSAVVFQFIWAADTATSGDTVWFFAVNSIADADSIDETWAYNPSVAATAPATARTQKTTLVSSVAGSYFAAGSTIRLRVVRLGNNGADTMTGDALLLGVRIEYTADM